MKNNWCGDRFIFWLLKFIIITLATNTNKTFLKPDTSGTCFDVITYYNIKVTVKKWEYSLLLLSLLDRFYLNCASGPKLAAPRRAVFCIEIPTWLTTKHLYTMHFVHSMHVYTTLRVLYAVFLLAYYTRILVQLPANRVILKTVTQPYDEGSGILLYYISRGRRGNFACRKSKRPIWLRVY